MQVIINGEFREIDPQNINNLLEDLDIDPRKVAVELNSEILPKAVFETTFLGERDRLEIVHFVGGG